MSNTKHTPGKWRFYTEPQPNGCPIVGNEKGLMVAMLAHSINYNDQAAEAVANARLIAAAPELLEALEACLATLSDERIGTCTYMEGVDIYSDFRNAADKARAAISKARGEA